MSFKGYYAATSVLITDFSNKPTPVDMGDTVIAVWQDENLNRTARTFTYDDATGNWDQTGEISIVVSVSTELLPLESRYLSNLDPNGLGMFATNYAYVNTIDPITARIILTNWGSSRQVGQDMLSDPDDLEVRDIFTGQVVTTPLSTLGLLPIYVRSNGAVVGVGSAVYTGGSWVILWYKMALAAGSAPRVVYDTATIIDTKSFKMAGDTSTFKLRLYTDSETFELIPGVPSGGYTIYSFVGYDAWTFFTLSDSAENIVYQSRKGLYDASFEQVTADGPLKNLSLTDAIGRINEIFTGGGDAVTINHAIV